MWRRSLSEVEIIQPEPAEHESVMRCIECATAGQTIPVEWKIEINRAVSRLRRAGAEALLLADTTLGQWIKPGDSLLYPIDAAEVHAWTATHWAIAPGLLPAPGCVICG